MPCHINQNMIIFPCCNFAIAQELGPPERLAQRGNVGLLDQMKTQQPQDAYSSSWMDNIQEPCKMVFHPTCLKGWYLNSHL